MQLFGWSQISVRNEETRNLNRNSGSGSGDLFNRMGTNNQHRRPFPFGEDELK
jgi:hypothetical protein